MGYLANNHIKSVFDLKRARSQPPEPDSAIAEINGQVSRRATARIIAKTVVIVAEAALLAFMVYYYIMNR